MVLFEHVVVWSGVCHSSCLHLYAHVPLLESNKWGDYDCGPQMTGRLFQFTHKNFTRAICPDGFPKLRRYGQMVGGISAVLEPLRDVCCHIPKCPGGMAVCFIRGYVNIQPSTLCSYPFSVCLQAFCLVIDWMLLSFIHSLFIHSGAIVVCL